MKTNTPNKNARLQSRPEQAGSGSGKQIKSMQLKTENQIHAHVIASAIAKAITQLDTAVWYAQGKLVPRLRQQRNALFNELKRLGYEMASPDSSRIKKL